MSNSWDRLHARNTVVNTIVTRAADGIPAAAAWKDMPGVWDHFEDEGHLLRELQQHWFHSLAASVENALEVGEGDLAEDVRRAYRSTAQRHLGLRRILDEFATHPAIEALVRREHSLLARAAGVSDAAQVVAPVSTIRMPEQRRRNLIARVFRPEASPAF